MKDTKLPLTEDLDFHYLLSLMLPISKESGFEWLPELFSIIGVDSLIKLCKYAGGELIRIPTLEELQNSIDALQWFYDVEIAHRKDYSNAPQNLIPLIDTIKGVYCARNSEN